MALEALAHRSHRTARVLAQSRTVVLGQGMMFVLGAGFFMWFLGSLRSYLARVETDRGRITMIAFVAGTVGYGVTVLALAPQIALTLPDRTWVEPATAAMATDLGYVMLTVGNLPMAVMYAAVAVVCLQEKALPAWLGWIAAAAAASCTVLVFSLVDPAGPLAPQGWLSYVLYLVPVAWLTAATTVMLTSERRRAAEPVGQEGVPDQDLDTDHDPDRINSQRRSP